MGTSKGAREASTLTPASRKLQHPASISDLPVADDPVPPPPANIHLHYYPLIHRVGSARPLALLSADLLRPASSTTLRRAFPHGTSCAKLRTLSLPSLDLALLFVFVSCPRGRRPPARPPPASHISWPQEPSNLCFSSRILAATELRLWQ